MLQIKNFSKTYKGDFKAVDNISLTVNSGDICAFIGPNGAGKSTTLKSIAGILDFEDGEIFIDDKSIKMNPIECKKVLAYVPEEPNIYSHLTGIQYLNFIANIFEVNDKSRILKYVKRFGMESKIGDLISSYSKGMKQKVVLISAVIHKPKLLILDEPFTGLDPIARIELRNIMKELCNNGSAIFFSTHVLEVAQKVCNQAIIINKGKIITSGSMIDVLGHKSLEDIFLEVINDE